jgi:Domain of unknown function (DUF4349)
MSGSECILRDLRALPYEASSTLRERVRALGEPQPGWTLLQLPWRRALLVLAPACVVALAGAAVVHGVLSSDTPTRQTLTSGGAARTSLPIGAPAGVLAPVAAPSAGTAGDRLLPPTPGRRQDYEASMTLRVRDLGALTDRTNEAMQVVRSYGGYVGSVQQSTSAGQPGESDLVLRVPVGHVEAAMVKLSELGTVLARQVSIVDLEQALRQQRARIVRLKVYIARATEQLKGDLPVDVRLRLQLQLQQARQELVRATRANQATLDETAFSHVSLTLTTQQPVLPTHKGGTGRFERTARSAGSFLAGAGAVGLFLLIVLSPIIVSGVACVLGLRAYRRREERRLLAA